MIKQEMPQDNSCPFCFQASSVLSSGGIRLVNKNITKRRCIMATKKQGSHIPYKNGKTEISSESDNKQACIMRWSDFVLRWLFRFAILLVIYKLGLLKEVVILISYFD